MYSIRGKMGKLNITIVYYSTKVYLREAFPRQENQSRLCVAWFAIGMERL